MRNLLLAITAVLLAVLLADVIGGNRRAIAQAQAEAAWLQGQRDSLVAVISEREQQQAVLIAERDSNHALAQYLRDSVVALERSRSAAQFTIRQIRTVGALQKRLRTAFPELGKAGWGLTTIPTQPGDTIGIQYLVVPAWFAETFVIDHENAESWRAQKDRLLAVDSLRLTVIALQDSVTRLVAANAEAYQTGYRTAYMGYQDLSRRYVAELKKPRIRLGSALGILGAAGVGVVIGRTIP
jgi:hypothetical protein